MFQSSPRYLVCTVLVFAFLTSCAAPTRKVVAPPSQVLFVCEHGNVKSLMAASYFNRLAEQRGLPYHAVSRGSAPDSDTVPPKIAAALGGDGYDVHDFHPVAVSAADVAASKRVVTIGVPLSPEITGGATIEQWNDVPPASVDYAAARAALEQHIRVLLDGLAAR